MGKINTITKDYMSKPEHFADSFNYYLFKGEQVIQPENLKPLDPTELAVIPTGESAQTVEKMRDVLKNCVLMKDERAHYLLLGIENQTNIHYALPVKNMIYDALNYGKQVASKAKEHREKKDLTDTGEFLSGFARDDKIKPVLTLVVYFGTETWDAPRSLKEMFEGTDENILRFVEDYRVHLIIPKEITDFSKFKTDFGKAMKYIAASKNKDELLELRKDKLFQEVDVKTVELLNACLGCKIPIERGKEKVNMRNGFDEIEEMGRKGREEAFGLAKQIFRMYMQGKSEQEIADACNLSIQAVEEILQ